MGSVESSFRFDIAEAANEYSYLPSNQAAQEYARELKDGSPFIGPILDILERWEIYTNQSLEAIGLSDEEVSVFISLDIVDRAFEKHVTKDFLEGHPAIVPLFEDYTNNVERIITIAHRSYQSGIIEDKAKEIKWKDALMTSFRKSYIELSARFFKSIAMSSRALGGTFAYILLELERQGFDLGKIGTSKEEMEWLS